MGERAALDILYSDRWLSNRGKYSKIRSCVNFHKGLPPRIFCSNFNGHNLPATRCLRWLFAGVLNVVRQVCLRWVASLSARNLQGHRLRMVDVPLSRYVEVIMRVLMVSKACLVGSYQTKLEAIAAFDDVELSVIVPAMWQDPAGEIRLERSHTDGYRLLVDPIRLNGHYHLHY